MEKEDLILQALAKIQEQMNEGFTEVKTEIRNVKERVIRIENEHGKKLAALFDSREVQNDYHKETKETLARLETKLDDLSLKVTSHDVTLKQNQIEKHEGAPKEPEEVEPSHNFIIKM